MTALTKDYYATGETAKYLEVSVSTVKLWVRKGLIQAERSPTNRCMFSRAEILRVMNERHLIAPGDDPNSSRMDVVYARVSGADQKKHGDLERQALHIIEMTPDLHSPKVFMEVGSGLNDHRRELMAVMKLVMEGQVNRIIVTYRDRLTRFGFHCLEAVCERYGTRLQVLHDTDGISDEEELAEDMMALIASFSGKLYGMRSRRNRRETEDGGHRQTAKSRGKTERTKTSRTEEKADANSPEVKTAVSSLVAVLEGDEQELDHVVLERIMYLTHINRLYQQILQILDNGGTVEEIRCVVNTPD